MVEATVPTQPMAAVKILVMAVMISVIVMQFLSLDFAGGKRGVRRGRTANA